MRLAHWTPAKHRAPHPSAWAGVKFPWSCASSHPFSASYFSTPSSERGRANFKEVFLTARQRLGGGTLRHTIRTMLRSYDIRASGDRNVPIVRARGKCDEHKPNYHTAAVPISRLAYPLNFIGAAAFLYELRQNVSSYLMKKQFLTGGASIWISRLPLRPPTKR